MVLNPHRMNVVTLTQNCYLFVCVQEFDASDAGPPEYMISETENVEGKVIG